jgi:defect-in-organelle-trafficking protein DotB
MNEILRPSIDTQPFGVSEDNDDAVPFPAIVPADNFLWPDETASFTRASLDKLLVWAFRLGASDIRIQTNRPIFIELHGRLRVATSRSLNEGEVEECVNRFYGSDGLARLKQGCDFDVSYEVMPDRRTRMRFRINATAILTRGDDGAAVVGRTLPSRAPALADLNVEPGILAAYKPGDGIVIVAGGTGNGKSTLLAAMTRSMLEDPHSHRAILEYSAPIEFVFDDIQGTSSTIEQSEIPRHLPDFPSAIRNAMRRAPKAIIVGECRDGETITAAVDAAITQHTVYTTIHAGRIADTVQRVVSLCPDGKRRALTVAFAQSLRLIVNQRLVASTDGKRTALREFLVFNDRLRRCFLDADPDRWPALAQDTVDAGEHGQSFGAAITRALDAGRISPDEAHLRRMELGYVA